MGLAHQSIATINSPEFINLQPLDINPLMSSCQIKVFYLGENRNGSYISKQVATEMSKTLRGAPIVGYYKQNKEDFADHGQQMVLDDEGFHFNCLTKPYGFVSPDAKVWFQDFEESDGMGNSKIRTYLMTTGYLWTGQFEQAQIVVDQGRPHSMEIDEKSLKGEWSKNFKNDMEFFIINDAIFSKLCILGNDVEPCFEGSGITAPEVSASFTLNNDFKQTLFEMMEQLTEALKGGNTTVAKENLETNEVNVEQTSFAENNNELENAEVATNFEEQTSEENSTEEIQIENEFAAKEEKEDEKENSDEENSNEDSSDNEEDKEDDSKKKYTALEEQYNELKTNYDALEQEVVSLREFKLNIENEKKDELINQFYMLSEEDKKDVIENKSKYTLEEIESKLAVICFKKKVNFNLDNNSENEDSKEEKLVVTTFNIEQTQDSTPDWVKKVESTMNKY